MPTFTPFTGIRYRRSDVSAVIAPPYDVISDEQRLVLEASDRYNAVHLELPQPDGASDRYQAAAMRLAEWLDGDGPLAVDAYPSFTVYRMSWADAGGATRETTGVIGALGLQAPGQGDILPHERTTPKAKSDRLDLIRATATNLSPVWGLSLATGLSDLVLPVGPPRAAGTDRDGVRHETWVLTENDRLEAIGAAVASAPVVIADGHHRYEVALAYQNEQREARGGAAGLWDSVMTYVVELSEQQLTVAAIHRLIGGLPERFDLLDSLREWFEPVGRATVDATIVGRMAEAGAVALLLGGDDEAELLRPRAKTIEAAEHDLDSSRLDVALAGLPAHELSYEHNVSDVSAAVRSERADAGVLLRPATVAQIGEVARARDRMPPKTTFFTPKPATGLVFRKAG